MNRVFVFLCGLASGLGGVATVQSATIVRFDKDEYFVSAAGETFAVQVLVDGDDQTLEIEPVRSDLYSFGASFSFDSAKAKVVDVGSVVVEPGLDHFGFATGAFRQVADGFAGGKGNVDQNLQPLELYTGSVLMTVTMTNQASPVDSYPLTLDFFRTLGDNEQIFLNGTGTVLDAQIVFGTAIVRVVPEPSTSMLSALALWGFGRWRKRGGCH